MDLVEDLEGTFKRYVWVLALCVFFLLCVCAGGGGGWVGGFVSCCNTL